jgi:hypothetical protein
MEDDVREALKRLNRVNRRLWWCVACALCLTSLVGATLFLHVVQHARPPAQGGGNVSERKIDPYSRRWDFREPLPRDAPRGFVVPLVTSRSTGRR